MNESEQIDQVRTTCVTCGGYPGGVVWEGYVLPAVVTVDDIAVMLGNAVTRRTVLGWFARGELGGSKLGKSWTIRASRFVADFTRLECRAPEVALRPRKNRDAKPELIRLRRRRLEVVDTRGAVAS